MLGDCVTASLYYSLHNDTLPKPNRGDASSLSSSDQCSRAFKIQRNSVIHLLTELHRFDEIDYRVAFNRMVGINT